MKYRPIHVAEYVALRALAWVVRVLPYRAALSVGWVVAAIGFYVVRFRVRAACARIRSVFGEQYAPAQVRRMAWQSLRNVVFSGVELIRVPVVSSDWIQSVVERDPSVETLIAHVRAGKGAIIATIHMGSWEMSAMACLAYGIPLFSLAAPQKNPLTDAYLNQMRARTGFETVLRTTNVLKAILRKIREGKVLAILPDVRAKTESLPVRFLGQTANVAGGMALIARQTGVPIFPCIIVREGWTRHRYRVFDAVWPDPARPKEDDAMRMTQAVFDVFDRCVRAAPEQWLWYNKRWLFDPLHPTGRDQ